MTLTSMLFWATYLLAAFGGKISLSDIVADPCSPFTEMKITKASGRAAKFQWWVILTHSLSLSPSYSNLPFTMHCKVVLCIQRVEVRGQYESSMGVCRHILMQLQNHFEPSSTQSLQHFLNKSCLNKSTKFRQGDKWKLVGEHVKDHNKCAIWQAWSG